MRGYSAIGVFHSKAEVNIGTLYRSAFAFGAAFVFTVGRRYKPQHTDTAKSWRHIPIFHFSNLADLKNHLPFCCRLVGVEIADGAQPTTKYIHPEQACYLLGAEDHGLNKEAIDACHDVIVIPGLRYCLNVATAGSIVLYDRSSKDWRRKANGRISMVA